MPLLETFRLQAGHCCYKCWWFWLNLLGLAFTNRAVVNYDIAWGLGVSRPKKCRVYYLWASLWVTTFQ